MTWKVDDNGNIVTKEGNPVYVDNSGQEKTVEFGVITRLNYECKQHREAKEQAIAELKKFEGIDPVKAREAIETVSKMDAQKLIDAGKVDEVRNQITQSFTEKLNEKDEALKLMTEKYNSMMVKNVFSNSDFIRNNVAVPLDMFEALYRKNFKVEDGNVVVYDNNGNRLWSKEHEGEYANAEEGLKILAMQHPNHDTILRANIQTGSGSTGAGAGLGGYRTLRRSDFETLDPIKKSEVLKDIKVGKIKLTD